MRITKILIIGAGIAGLAAANKLNKLGLDVTILEARNRIGGRIWNKTHSGIMLSRGALWLHGSQGNPITKLANEFNVKKIFADLTKNIMFDHQGVLIKDSHREIISKPFTRLLENAKQLAFASPNDISLKDALMPFINTRKLFKNEKIIFERLLRFFENFYGAGYAELSGRYWDQEEILPGGQYILCDTYEPIIQGLANNCHIQFNTIINEIQMNKNEIKLITENEIFTADVVIITVPLGVLKHNQIKFSPELPIKKRQAIQRLGMGLLNIILLKFPEFFWPNDKLIFYLPSEDKLPISTFLNLGYALNQPLIYAYIGGQTGKELENYSDDETIKKIMSQLKSYFTKNIPDPDYYFVTRWSTDPFSYGSYSYLSVGATPEDYEDLSESIANRLFFAGEATHRQYSATTHGAYLSGIREAQKIINFYT